MFVAHQMAPAQPKGRGRPRASFAQTGEFDLGLIREYRARPALYDRTSKRYKDKLYSAQQWQLISHKLGYDVSLLRDRMLQLRNRFNIEKRRLEAMRSENPNAFIGSQWPLYESLDFLADHIRTRRSYKPSNTKLEDGPDDDEPYEVDDVRSESDGQPMPDVKVEMMGSEDDDQPMLTIPLNVELHPQNHQNQLNGSGGGGGGGGGVVHGRSIGSTGSSATTLPFPTVSFSESTPIISAAPKSKPTSTSYEPASSSSLKRKLAQVDNDNTMGVGSHKFRAFGEFVTHSLTDLPEITAMRLVERFASEIVQAVLHVNKQEQMQKIVSDDDDDDHT